jgi:hypothetical protein
VNNARQLADLLREDELEVPVVQPQLPGSGSSSS